MELFGIRLIGLNWQTLHKLILSVGFFVAVFVIRYLWVALTSLITGKHPNSRTVFWTRQITSLITACLLLLGFASIWFNNSAQMTTGLGLLSGGLAFALQKVITSIAGYVVIVRGKTFSVGDRITMSEVRGDVIALGFIQTRIMEMGQTPDPSADTDPGSWVQSLQYTGRIVSISNDKVFDSPVYNYTREFPYFWEESVISIPYSADRRLAEQILLEIAQDVVGPIQEYSKEDQKKIEDRYFIPFAESSPKVYIRMSETKLELHLRYLVHTRGVREVRDQMARQVLDRFEQNGIPVSA